MITIKRTHEVVALNVPTYITVKSPLNPNGVITVYIESLTDDELQKVGEQFTKDMIAVAKKRRQAVEAKLQQPTQASKNEPPVGLGQLLGGAAQAVGKGYY